MEAHRTRTRWTYAEFARLPSEGSTRHEVIAGELVVTPAPGLTHQRIATDLTTLLNAFVRESRLGQVFAAPVDVLFGEGDYLQPDIVFVRKERSASLSDRGIEGPPVPRGGSRIGRNCCARPRAQARPISALRREGVSDRGR